MRLPGLIRMKCKSWNICVCDSCSFWRFYKSSCTTLLKFELAHAFLLGEKQVPRHCKKKKCCQPICLELNWDHQTEQVPNGNYSSLHLSWASSEPSCEKIPESISYSVSRPTYPIQQVGFVGFKAPVSQLVVHQLFVLISKWPYLQHVISWIVD